MSKETEKGHTKNLGDFGEGEGEREARLAVGARWTWAEGARDSPRCIVSPAFPCLPLVFPVVSPIPGAFQDSGKTASQGKVRCRGAGRSRG